MKNLLILLLLAGLSLPGWSDTIIDGSVGPGGSVVSNSQSVAASWTMSSSFAEISIAVPLWTSGFGPAQTGTAYLASSTPGFQILSTQFIFPSNSAGDTLAPPQFVQLFNDLTLSAGTYYLTLVSTAPNDLQSWMNARSPSAVQMADGVTLGATYLGFPADGPYLGQEPSDSGFRDNTAFGSAGLQIFSDPDEDPVAATPEPPTFALVLGLALLGVAALKKSPEGQRRIHDLIR